MCVGGLKRSHQAIFIACFDAGVWIGMAILVVLYRLQVEEHVQQETLKVQFGKKVGEEMFKRRVIFMNHARDLACCCYFGFLCVDVLLLVAAHARRPWMIITWYILTIILSATRIGLLIYFWDYQWFLVWSQFYLPFQIAYLCMMGKFYIELAKENFETMELHLPFLKALEFGDNTVVGHRMPGQNDDRPADIVLGYTWVLNPAEMNTYENYDYMAKMHRNVDKKSHYDHM